MFYAAILIALLATFGAYRALQATKLGARAPTRAVVVAMRDIPEGTMVPREALALASFAEGSVPSGAFASLDSVAGRVTRVPIFRGDAIIPARLAPSGSGAGLEVKIAPGRRAMAVRINDVAGLSGLIQPNSRVDVLVTLRAEGSGDRQVAKLFMANMRVLSVGTHVQRGNDGKPLEATTATLEVTPADAERLAVAMNQGSIQLVLRGYGDPDSVRTTGANSADVLAQLRAAPERASVRGERLAGGEVENRRPAARPAHPRAVARPAPVETTQAPAQTPAPRDTPPTTRDPRQDTAVVPIYRGSQVMSQKVAKGDSATPRRPRTP